MDESLTTLVAQLGGDLTVEQASGQEAHMRVPPNRLRETIQGVLDAGYRMFIDLFGVDYPEREGRFEVVYHFAAPLDARRVFVHTACSELAAHLPTISDLVAGANWPEREVYDLFGVEFDAHPDLRRILMPDDWEGHPLRKDYPTRGTRPLGPISQL